MSEWMDASEIDEELPFGGGFNDEEEIDTAASEDGGVHFGVSSGAAAPLPASWGGGHPC